MGGFARQPKRVEGFEEGRPLPPVVGGHPGRSAGYSRDARVAATGHLVQRGESRDSDRRRAQLVPALVAVDPPTRDRRPPVSVAGQVELENRSRPPVVEVRVVGEVCGGQQHAGGRGANRFEVLDVDEVLGPAPPPGRGGGVVDGVVAGRVHAHEVDEVHHRVGERLPEQRFAVCPVGVLPPQQPFVGLVQARLVEHDEHALGESLAGGAVGPTTRCGHAHRRPHGTIPVAQAQREGLVIGVPVLLVLEPQVFGRHADPPGDPPVAASLHEGEGCRHLAGGQQ